MSLLQKIKTLLLVNQYLYNIMCNISHILSPKDRNVVVFVMNI